MSINISASEIGERINKQFEKEMNLFLSFVIEPLIDRYLIYLEQRAIKMSERPTYMESLLEELQKLKEENAYLRGALGLTLDEEVEIGKEYTLCLK